MIFREEKKLHKQGYRVVVGLDEAGRGPLAGPVIAGAVRMYADAKRANIADESICIIRKKIFAGIRDSKKLSVKQRESWYEILTNHPDIEWGVGIVSEKKIDRINILKATKSAMIKAVRNLEKKLGVPADFLVIDGNFTIVGGHRETGSRRNSPRPGLAIRTVRRQKAIPKADEKVFSCMAAGIIAKVTRDRIMRRLHKKYPQYGFDKHKGYGTKAHLRALRKRGPCEIHRKSFRPVRNIG